MRSHIYIHTFIVNCEQKSWDEAMTDSYTLFCEKKPRSKVLLRWQHHKSTAVYTSIFYVCRFCKHFRKRPKSKVFILWGILVTFNAKQTNSTDFPSTFLFSCFLTMGTHLTDLPPAKEFLAKCNISLIPYLTSRSPAQTKGLNCLCYCEPRTLKQAALSIMGTCVTFFYQHTYNGDLFNRFTSGVIL